MRKVISSIVCALTLVVSTFSFGHGYAAEKQEKVMYKTEMKSEKELRKDALAGKKDYDFKDIRFQLHDEKGNVVKDLTKYSHYTVQKLKETQVGQQVISDYVLYAVSDPSDYDNRDQDSNPALNFQQTVWMWTSIIKENNIDVWGKATRYEARWDLLDRNGLTIKSGEFTAKAYGRSKSNGTTLNYSDPKTYTPPAWGTNYVKKPTWDYVRIDDSYGVFGARLKTSYTARTSTGTLYSTVIVGSGSISW
ncbi:hypothetical protein HP567_000920 [Brevibacillus sp. M2.1A]|uniref:hypothetical protein n=1 Tax=Brevibacillus TaxID=55080 RepID=UPI00156BA0F2|nr:MULTISPECIES: hypothetical protein [Brevibacillus]MBY0084906.1 hypothetical protein [Brevibacillus brevis]MCC8433183.1 hypothetical protein [Brevibacillus sp. M2.1A]MCE0451120.1 hypothetical protein [Brevibacillus sp. AF8]UKL00910.1 hypothetical protein FO446_27375 [Brevibacillus brevis]